MVYFGTLAVLGGYSWLGPHIHRDLNPSPLHAKHVLQLFVSSTWSETIQNKKSKLVLNKNVDNSFLGGGGGGSKGLSHST